MPIILRPNGDRPADLDQYLGEGLDNLARLGAKTDHPKLKAAREIAERLPAIRQAAAELWARQDGGAQVAAAAVRYLAGELTTEQLPSEAASIDACGAYDNTASRIVDRAQRNVDNEVSAACRELGDQWITEILRPAVEQTMEAVTPELIADAWTAVNMQTDDRNAPTARPLRAALEKVEDIIATLDQLGDWAIAWRNYGWVPTPPRNTRDGRPKSSGGSTTTNSATPSTAHTPRSGSPASATARSTASSPATRSCRPTPSRRSPSISTRPTTSCMPR